MGLFGKLFGGGGAREDGGHVRALLAQCEEGDPQRRAAACAALGELAGRFGQSKEAVGEKLLELINDDDGDVCNAAAAAYSRVERGFV